jgi:murein DD-endopeptidase MepM/ murein hydrolase activator NlpD
VHVVAQGENLYRIALHYGVDWEDIARANGIDDPRELEVGMRLQIPGARSGPPARPLARPRDDDASALGFSWPVEGGTVTSGFGWRRGRLHDGIDISVPRGTPIYVVAPGRVIFSGRIGDYGNIIVVRHDARHDTVYAHNRRNLVRKGEVVVRGEEIAEVGSTGNATGPHVHFEVRLDQTPRDPMRYLP